MIHLQKGQTSTVVVTLTEKELLTSPNYVFHFKHRVTNEVVAFNVSGVDDNSAYPDRYNSFEIVVDTYFADAEAGQWSYEIYETAGSGTSITGLNLLESGIMWLEDGVQHTYTERVTDNEYKTR